MPRSRKSTEERIAEAQARLERDKRELRRLRGEQRSAERKARTRRLIEAAAMIESTLGRELKPEECFELGTVARCVWDMPDGSLGTLPDGTDRHAAIAISFRQAAAYGAADHGGGSRA